MFSVTILCVCGHFTSDCWDLRLLDGIFSADLISIFWCSLIGLSSRHILWWGTWFSRSARWLVLLGFGVIFWCIFLIGFAATFLGESMLEHLWEQLWWFPSKPPTQVSRILWFPKFILHLGFSEILEIDYGIDWSSGVLLCGSVVPCWEKLVV